MPQDLFITQEHTLSYLLAYLNACDKSTRFYDPCCGTFAIGDYLRGQGFTNIIERDLKEMEDMFLTSTAGDIIRVTKFENRELKESKIQKKLRELIWQY